MIIVYLAEHEPVITLKEISRIVGLSYSCVRRAVKNMTENDFGETPDFGIVKKGRKAKTSEHAAQIVKDHLTGSTTATLVSAKQLLDESGIHVGKTTVWRLAHMGSISFKRTAFKGEVVLSQRVIESRFLYGTRVNEMTNEELFFPDETGFNLHIGETRSWSPVCQTPVVVVPSNKGQNISALVCISTTGVETICIKDGAYNAMDFIVFLTDLAHRNQGLLNGEVTLVMDNARIHHAVDVITFLDENRINYMFLPPYSPELNPIELFFGTVKAAHRRAGPARTRTELKRRIRETFEAVGQDVNMNNYYNHTRVFVQKAMNREPFFFVN